MTMRNVFAVVLLVLTSEHALAYRVQPVTDKATQTECGACHMVYPAALLPASSWDAITSDLAHHFNEDASLDQAVVDGIKAYLMSNAGDVVGGGRGLIRGLQQDQTPLRITDMPVFHRIHGDFSPRTVKKIGVAGNCSFCHRAAADGMFEDD
jgi:Dihaem cytochrome c